MITLCPIFRFPLLSFKLPARIFNKVVLPAPFAPIKANFSFLSIFKSILFNIISFSLYPKFPLVMLITFFPEEGGVGIRILVDALLIFTSTFSILSNIFILLCTREAFLLFALNLFMKFCISSLFFDKFFSLFNSCSNLLFFSSI